MNVRLRLDLRLDLCLDLCLDLSLDLRLDVRLDLRSTVPPDRPQYAVVTLDDQLIGRVNADRSADALWFDHTHPGYARRVAEALVGRQLEAGDMTALTLEEVR